MHAIADNLSLYSRLSVVRNQSTGRFAPPAARYPGLLASDPANPFDVDVTGYWRWTEIGNRGSDFTDDASSVKSEPLLPISVHLQ